SPTFWLPTWRPAPGGMAVGALTEGMDALGRTLFTAAGGLSIPTGRPTFEIALQHALGGDGRVRLDVSASDVFTRSGEIEATWIEERQAAVGIGVVVPRLFDRSEWSLSFETGEERAFDDEGALLWHTPPKTSVRLGWQRLGENGRDEWRHLARTEISLARAADGSADWSAQLQRSDLFAPSPGQELRADVAAGWSGGEVAIAAGGIEGPFAVRGLPAGELSGQRALGLTLSYTGRIGRIARGLLDQPLFLDDVTLTPFFDAALVEGTSGRTSGASLGAELGADLIVAFGALELGARLGVAQSLWEARPPVLYLRLVAGF
ncbi:MAG TPA: hypothetical protein VF234_06890, partial [Limnochordia bacterium]